MKKQRKIIGILTSRVESAYQRQMITCITKIALAHNYDVLVFSVFVTDYANLPCQVGERNIYNLINYELIDGLIIVPDFIRLHGVLPKIEQDIKEKFNGPVVSVDHVFSDYPVIETDDLTSMRKLISHLIKDHGYKSFVVMTGPSSHEHARRRLAACLKVLEEFEIHLNEKQIFYGDFWYDQGERVINDILLNLKELPDVIMCTNDYMALSICNALEKLNYSIPRDIAVTGFDSVIEGDVHKPSITTMTLSPDKLGIRAVNQLLNELEGINLDTSISTACTLKLGESCGCNVHTRNITIDSMRNLENDDNDAFYSSYSTMLEELVGSADLNECLDRIQWHSQHLGDFDHFYLALCHNWDYVGCSHEASLNYNTTNYTSKMHLHIACSNNHENAAAIDVHYPSSIMLPALWEDRTEPGIFFFSPLHFNDRCFGYTVISYDNKAQTFPVCYRDWMRFVNVALENIRIKNNFLWSNMQLEEYAQIDSLTKIFNRNGYTRYSEAFYEQSFKENKELLVLIGDINKLKNINDSYGHIEGDNAIQLCAVAFQRACSNFEKCFRYGGDEFILLGVKEYTKSEVLLIERGIQSYLYAYNEVSDKPYKVSISLGCWHGRVDNQHTFDEYLKLADKAMFLSKSTV